MKIVLNGQAIDTNCKTLYELKREYYGSKDNIVTIIEGFATNDDVELHENSEVTFIEKGKLPSKEVFEHMLCARHTPKVHEKVKKSRVAVAGLGGLGSNIAISLARTGVGTLHLIDFDRVEPSNLNRQQYKISHLGMYKTEALKKEISEINPFVEVIVDRVKVTEENLESLFKDDDIVCEAFDNPEGKALLVNGILQYFPGKKVVASSGMAGFESSNTIKTRKITNDFYLCGDGETSARIGRGLMAPRVSICAGHQANMILRLILEEKDV